MSKPDKRLQLLRGARLALQHDKDWTMLARYGSPVLDAQEIEQVHRTEYRKLSFAGRIAYKHWTAA